MHNRIVRFRTEDERCGWMRKTQRQEEATITESGARSTSRLRSFHIELSKPLYGDFHCMARSKSAFPLTTRRFNFQIQVSDRRLTVSRCAGGCHEPNSLLCLDHVCDLAVRMHLSSADS